jgi:hypothetical protein
MWRTTRALARLAGAWAHDMRMNGPSKSDPPCGALLPFVVLFFGCLAVKFRALTDCDKDLNGTRVYRFVDNV